MADKIEHSAVISGPDLNVKALTAGTAIIRRFNGSIQALIYHVDPYKAERDRVSLASAVGTLRRGAYQVVREAMLAGYIKGYQDAQAEINAGNDEQGGHDGNSN